ncbi:MAG: hypothetical protein N2558_04615 [Patescibacteria group bacterium]|nr:hypothetical protein [Patescibacteria group bacterium]
MATGIGALTYQYAYFVDPRMCESAASYQDTNITRVVGHTNKTLASAIPYHDTLSLKRYQDKKSQSMFQNAGMFQKALLVKKANYNRNRFFPSSTQKGI